MISPERPDVIVFLGPSAPLEIAKSILPAMYLPPAAQGDIVSAARRFKPRTILLVDGVFGQQCSVWHKELLWVLSQGIAVYGSSSMGALRAAELHSYGMIGLGRIFESYRTEEIRDDDEVALLFGPAELGWLALSVPMVNIRATTRHLREAGLLSCEIQQLVDAAAKSIHFKDRTLATVRNELAKRIPLEADTLCDLLEAEFVNQKQEDTLAALRHVLAAPPFPVSAPFTLNRTASMEILFEQDLPVAMADGRSIRKRELAKYVALTHPHYQKLNMSASMASAAIELAAFLEIEPSPELLSMEAARIRLGLDLSTDAELVDWCADNDLLLEEFEGLVKRRATCRLIQQWVTTRRGRRENSSLVLDELRLSGEYVKYKRQGCSLLAETGTSGPLHQVPDVMQVFKELLVHTTWDIDTDLETWYKEACFVDLEELSAMARQLAIRSRAERDLLLDLIYKGAEHGNRGC